MQSMYFCIASSFDIPTPYSTVQGKPFSAFHAFHFAFSYAVIQCRRPYSEVEHARSRDIAVTDGSLLEESVSGELVVVAHGFRGMPVADVLGSFLELLLLLMRLESDSTSKSDMIEVIIAFFGAKT